MDNSVSGFGRIRAWLRRSLKSRRRRKQWRESSGFSEAGGIVIKPTSKIFGKRNRCCTNVGTDSGAIPVFEDSSPRFTSIQQGSGLERRFSRDSASETESME